MVKGSFCGRQVSLEETMYTIPWLPYGHERGQKAFESSVGKLYTSTVKRLRGAFCGLTYSHERGMWVCRECAYKNGYLW